MEEDTEEEKLDYLYSEIDEFSFDNFSMPHFYQYLRSSNPFIIMDGCSDWPAIEKWDDENYLID